MWTMKSRLQNKPMKIFSGIALSLILAATFSSCGGVKMRPLKKSVDHYDCYGDSDDSRTIYSPIEDSLMRQGALKSRKIHMESGIGMMEKTARLFVLDNREARIVFHFIHPIDLEIKKFGFAMQGDAGKLVSGELKVDYRSSIGGMAEEHAYLTYPMDKMANLLEDKRVSIEIEDMLFSIPFECRETFREMRNKNGAR
jgi:hypothetical protein